MPADTFTTLEELHRHVDALTEARQLTLEQFHHLWLRGSALAKGTSGALDFLRDAARSIVTPESNIPDALKAPLFLLLSGWQPELHLPPLQAMSHGDTNFDGVRGAIDAEIDEDVLRLRCRLHHPALWGGSAMGAQRLTASFAGGWTLASDQALISNARTSFSASSSSESFDIRAHYWKLRAPSLATPGVWVGRIRGHVPSLSGNTTTTDLTVTSDTLHRSGSDGHLFLEGNYTYLVVSSKIGALSLTHLLVSCGTRALDRQLLTDDVFALQFALGQRLRIDVLFGIDERGQSLMIEGGYLGSRHESSQSGTMPVPGGIFDRPWPVILFEKISRFQCAPHGFKLYMAIDAFLTASDAHVDARYGQLQLALGALAYAHTRAPADAYARPMDGLVNSLFPALQRRASATKALLGLRRVLEVGAPDDCDTILLAAQALRIPITPALLDEVTNRRRQFFRTGRMSLDTSRDLDGDLQRIALLRALVVAFIARIVDYRGPITGWARQKHRAYEAAEASWWDHSKAEFKGALHLVSRVRIGDDSELSACNLIVEGEARSVRIVTAILRAAGVSLAHVTITSAHGESDLIDKLRTLSPETRSKTVLIIEATLADREDAVARFSAEANGEVRVCPVVPQIEAWIFADDIALARAAATAEARDLVARIPLPEEVPDPARTAFQILPSEESWSFLEHIDVERGAARCGSLRVFLDAVGDVLGLERREREATYGRSMSRDALATLVREIAPADVVVWRNADGVAYTGARLAQEIVQGTEDGLRYVSELLRVSAGFIKRASGRTAS